MIRVSLLPPRCYIAGRRVHHGLVGLLLIAHDWRDRRRWVRDFLAHPSSRRRDAL